jgi:hypothetical protein
LMERQYQLQPLPPPLQETTPPATPL